MKDVPFGMYLSTYTPINIKELTETGRGLNPAANTMKWSRYNMSVHTSCKTIANLAFHKYLPYRNSANQLPDLG